MDELGTGFESRTRGLILKDAPAELVDTLRGLFAPQMARRSRVRIVAELLRDLAAPIAVAGARGGPGTRQIVHGWEDAECVWSVDLRRDAIVIDGHLLRDVAVPHGTRVTAWSGSGLAEAPVDDLGEFRLEVPFGESVLLTIDLDGREIVLGPVPVEPDIRSQDRSGDARVRGVPSTDEPDRPVAPT